MLLAVLIPLLLLQTGIYYSRLQAERERELQANLELARSVAKSFTEFINDILRQEDAVGMLLAGIYSPTYDQLNEILSADRARWQIISELGIVSPSGIVVSSTRDDAAGQDVSGEPYYTEIAGGKEWAVCRLLSFPTLNQPIFAVSRGVRDPTGSLKAVFVAQILPESLKEVMGFERIAGGAITILDTDGVAIYRNPPVQWSWEDRDFLRRHPFMADVFKGRPVVKISSDTDGRERIFAFTPIPSLGWAAGAERPEAEVMEPVVHGLLRDTGLFFLVGALTFLIALAISQTIVNPLRTLREHAAALGRGDLARKAVIEKPAELRDLADTFNSMADEIGFREEELRKAHDELEARVWERTKKLGRACEVLRNKVAERKQAELQIRKAQGMLQAVFDGISEPLIMLDKDLHIRMLNLACSSYLDINDLEEVVGKRCFEVSQDRIQPCEGCKIASAIAVGAKDTFERMSPNNPDRYELVVVYPLREQRAGFEGAIIRLHDITERKKLEKQLTRADRLSSLGQLSGGIAHEIRNPLSGINLFVDILSSEEKYPRTKQELDILDEIKRNVQKIDGIIKRVLDFAKQSGNNHAKVDVNPLITETLKLWQSKMRNSDIRLNLTLTENLPAILGDSIEIQQVVNNLVQNAIEAMKEGGLLSITTSRGPFSFRKDREMIKITIEDSGHGIEAELQKSIFNPFFTTKPTGTGLGLSISHQIVVRHGGVISLDSKPDSGTTFTVELPVAREE